MGKRQPVRGQTVKWCVCGEWFASERDEREHVGRCPGPQARLAPLWSGDPPGSLCSPDPTTGCNDG